jgi:hypothetical protein
MLQAFIDDSGRGQGPAFVLSGYMATPAVWEKFSDDWRAELSSDPPIQYFKMKEAASRRGQFAGHKREVIAHRLSTLVSILERHDIKGVTVAVDRDAFLEIVIPYVGKLAISPAEAKMVANPYLLLFYQLIVLVTYAQQNLGEREPIDFVFDEQGKEGEDVTPCMCACEGRVSPGHKRA